MLFFIRLPLIDVPVILSTHNVVFLWVLELGEHYEYNRGMFNKILTVTISEYGENMWIRHPSDSIEKRTQTRFTIFERKSLVYAFALSSSLLKFFFASARNNIQVFLPGGRREKTEALLIDFFGVLPRVEERGLLCTFMCVKTFESHR